MKSFDQLQYVMRRLRGRKGCPWDKKQTHQTLLKYLDEEIGELRRALRKKDWHNFEEELGDVLLQVMFHSQIAKEAGRFSIRDVIQTLTRKLTLRHPHVFGYKAIHRRHLKNTDLSTVSGVLGNWKILKKISARKRRRRPV